MSQSSSESTKQSEIVKMEINGHPYYLKSKGNVPYLYDIDTNDEVGYWSSKKGQYVMFTLYNRMIKQKYNDTDALKSNSKLKEKVSEIHSEPSEESSSLTSSSSSSSSRSSSPSSSPSSSSLSSPSSYNDEEDHATDATSDEKQMNTYSLIFLFIVLFVYLVLQKEFQSIYFDFIFLILINLLNTLKVFEILNDE